MYDNCSQIKDVTHVDQCPRVEVVDVSGNKVGLRVCVLVCGIHRECVLTPAASRLCDDGQVDSAEGIRSLSLCKSLKHLMLKGCPLAMYDTAVPWVTAHHNLTVGWCVPVSQAPRAPRQSRSHPSPAAYSRSITCVIPPFATIVSCFFDLQIVHSSHHWGRAPSLQRWSPE